MYENKYGNRTLLEKLTILRDELFKKGENNKYTDLLTKWIDNTNGPNTIDIGVLENIITKT